ncbi:MAG: 4'-phosphopantetheinyl transferase superfamily protein [Acidobacteriota bacterium]
MALSDGEVHVWTAALDPPDSAVSRLARLLSPDEAARAGRYRFERDRRSYTVARGTLRVLLGGYLVRPPESLTFAYGEQGKPSLAGAWDGDLRFNLSHSAGLGVFAFSRGVEVGVDVEAMRDTGDLHGLAERFFSAEEAAALGAVPAEARPEAFYRCWSAKEAYIKGVGEGLSMPLDRFAVSLEPPEGEVGLRILAGKPPDVAWRIHRFAPRAGYVAALAVGAAGLRVRFGEWSFPEPI